MPCPRKHQFPNWTWDNSLPFEFCSEWNYRFFDTGSSSSLGFTSIGGHLRRGTLGLTVYEAGVNTGVPVLTPALASQDVVSITLPNTNYLVKAGNLFNVSEPVPGAPCNVQVCFEGLDIDGNPTFTDLSNTVVHTPAITDNVLYVNVEQPVGVIFVLVFVNGLLAQRVQSDPRVRRSEIATKSIIPVYYRASGQSIKAATIATLQTGNEILPFKSYELPPTTGALSHTINFTKIDVAINDLPNATIATRSSQEISGTFVAPKAVVQALLSGGTFESDSGLVQLGIKSGACMRNKYFELTFPGDDCDSQYDAVFYAEPVHGDDSMEVNYSSEATSDLPFKVKEAATVVNKGLHSLTLRRI